MVKALDPAAPPKETAEVPTDPSGEAASNDQADPHQAAQTDPEVPGCWCCGASCPESDLVRLGAHPAVGVCVDCAHFLHRRARAIRSSALPVGSRSAATGSGTV